MNKQEAMQQAWEDYCAIMNYSNERPTPSFKAGFNAGVDFAVQRSLEILKSSSTKLK